MAIAKKKKKFFDAEIPIISKTTHLIAFDIKELEGRTITYDLTRMLKGKNTLLKTKVFLEDDKATSKPIGLTVLPAFMKRMARKGTNYVEESFDIESQDAQIRIKPFLVTRRKVSRAVRNALRTKMKEELINYFASKDTKTIFEEILKNALQKELSLKLKKIYPLSLCEIRDIRVNKELDVKPKKEEKEEKVEEEVEEETEKKE
jgi:ribosomal protein S3AE